MEKRWVLKKTTDKEAVKQLSNALNINERLSILLVQRGIKTYDEAKRFFRPGLKHLHDPFLMKDMDKAVDRILLAHERGEKIMVFGDYDVDGTTAVALVYSFIRRFHKKVEFYIPDRYKEGYGISYKGIDFACENGFTLLIALDCGIKAVEKVKYAKQHGLEIIIGDHHRPGDVIPDAAAVLDPKQPECLYPFKDLSGCGVGFKLIQAIAKKRGNPESTVFSGIDLVAVSIAADIVPMIGENRVLAYYGLKKINEKPRAGLRVLLSSAGLGKNKNSANFYFDREITINDLVFLVGPRINATGRIEDATDSVRLLISRENEYAEKLGKQINELNLTRRDLDTGITIEAIDVLTKDKDHKNRRTTVVYKETWHKGVIGIVASRLIETFYRPTIVLTRSGDLITGSARSIKNFDIYDAIDSCSHLLEHFGGHTYAAGLALKPENLDRFIEEFENYASERLTDEMMIPEIEIDEELYISDINSKFFRILKQFAPFGPGNMSPSFQTTNVIDTGYVKLVGKNGSNHLKFSVVHPDHTGSPFPAIAFNQGQHFEDMITGKTFSICYHIDENYWQGHTSLQLRIKDIKFD
ncbi:MAG TPA: single-stranded-DNA-specific exonuclease RecJ [Bacteroidetes bacterium]|nr:single-stranded-DNA-specific exonuclease RecJ [Bacteroidota bacterium]